MKVRTAVLSAALLLVALWPAPASAHFTHGFSVVSWNFFADPPTVQIAMGCTAGERFLVQASISFDPGEYRGWGYTKGVCTGGDQNVNVQMSKERGNLPQFCPPQTLRIDAAGVNKVGGDVHGKARDSEEDIISTC